MPELPEAETIARGLSQVLPGRVVARVSVLREDVVDGPGDAFAAAVEGERFGLAGRRGKNVVLSLDNSSRVVVNLGMTGRLLSDRAASAHPAVLFRLEDGGVLVYDDVRRFGRVALLAAPEWRRWSRSLGPEPLARSFTASRLHSILARSRSPVRNLLLDQNRIAGVGNIYAVEALWAARIHPRTPADAVDSASAARLHRALRKVLRDAIRARGTTLRNYRAADGAEGGFGPALRAYGRAGEPCARCRAPIRRTVFNGRSAFHCPRCQGAGHDPRSIHPMARPVRPAAKPARPPATEPVRPPARPGGEAPP